MAACLRVIALICLPILFVAAGQTESGAQQAQRDCFEVEGRCIAWTAKTLKFTPDERFLDFTFAFYRDRQRLTPWGIARLTLETGSIILVQSSCVISVEDFAFSPDMRTRALALATRPVKEPGHGTYAIRSRHFLRLEDLERGTTREFLQDNRNSIYHIQFDARSAYLYVLRLDQPRFDRLERDTGKLEFVYPGRSYDNPKFSPYTAFTINRSGTHLAVVGSLPNRTDFLEDLAKLHRIEETKLRTLFLVYEIEVGVRTIGARTIRYHELHERSDLHRRRVNAIQFVGERLFVVPEREWSEQSTTLYEYAEQGLVKRVEVDGNVVRNQISNSARFWAYTHSPISQELNPGLSLVVADLGGGKRIELPASKVGNALKAHLDCRDFYKIE